MIANWFAASPSGLLLARRGGDGGEMRLLPWIFALMAYVAGLGAVGLPIVDRSAADWRRAFSGAMTLEIPADTSPARRATVMALLRQTSGVASARLLTAAETARLLEPWLGPGAQLDGLPMPRLIDLRANPATAVDLQKLTDELASAVPGAKLDDHRQWLFSMERAVRRLRIGLGAAVAVGLLSIAATAIFAARSAANADNALIELLHLLGAGDRDIVRPFVLRALRLGLTGGAIGAAAAVLTLAAFERAAAAVASGQPTPPVGVAVADWRIWASLTAVALAAGLIAAVSTQASLRRRLTALP